MKITAKPGRLFSGDKLYFIETKGEEVFSLHRLLLLINQIAINESKRYEKYLPSLLFEDAVKEVIELSKQGTDLADDKHRILSQEFCRKHKLNYEVLKQTKIDEFKEVENGST